MTATALAAMRIKKGSTAKDIRPKDKGKKKQRQDIKNVECYSCQAKGHYARDCPQRKSKKSDRDEKGSQDCAFVATYTQEKCIEDQCDRYIGSLSDQRHKLLSTDHKDV